MNQGFRLRFDQMRESDPTSSDLTSGEEHTEIYQQPGYARNLCLIWVDGRRLFLNYAYLLAGEFEPNSDKNKITLRFSSHTVFLQGFALDRLFMALLDHTPRLIVAIDPRYVLEDDKQKPTVVDMIVEKKDE